MANTFLSTARKQSIFWLTLILLCIWVVPSAFAVPLPGGSLNPLTIPKYVQPLVIPPEMPKATVQPAPTDPGDTRTVPTAEYNIAVRQFQQQILPGGIWNTVNGRNDGFGATTVWSYGPAETVIPANHVSPTPISGNVAGTPGFFNYPAFTVEAVSDVKTTVRWINDLVDQNGNFLPHLLPVDQTLHWANPTGADCIDTALNKDCATLNAAPYTGPVPMVVHVHGAHVNAESDGYPEAWWLPAANDIPTGYQLYGSIYTQNDGAGNIQNHVAGNETDFDPVDGAAFYSYENSQPAATIWYHDHSLGITRLNVYAGPAGFWLVRADAALSNGGLAGRHDAPTTNTGAPAVLPGPAPRGFVDPNFDAVARAGIREIPIVIQDRSFNADGSLFYPDTRAFFDGFTGPYIDGASPSDINPIWNPEAFFNTMVVNGTTWPVLEVAQEKYRFRFLNGSNSRFLNLSALEVKQNRWVNRIDAALQRLIARLAVRWPARAARLQARLTAAQNQRPARYGVEVPFYQIGGDQGFLPQVVKIQTGSMTALPGDGTAGTPVALPAPEQAMLMAPAERADVIMDFSGYANGTIIRIINTAPDAPFGGFPDIPADASTSGQVMQFVINRTLNGASSTSATATDPSVLNLNAETAIAIAPSNTRQQSLNEEESVQVCVYVDPMGNITTAGSFPTAQADIGAACNNSWPGSVPQGPKAALLGLLGTDPTDNNILVGSPRMWKDPITENPAEGATEDWEFYNLTVDGHPIHMHLVRYNILNRQLLDLATNQPTGALIPPLPSEVGYKDTVLSYPGEVTRVRATFDLPGLYVWHCHILEHEDNEMMRPFFVGSGDSPVPIAP